MDQTNQQLKTRAALLSIISNTLLVPKRMTVEAGHELCHALTDEIEARLAHSHTLVHIEPCQRECDGCELCSKIALG